MEVQVSTFFCKYLALLVLVASSSLMSRAEPANVVLITLDTTRADRVGFLG